MTDHDEDHNAIEERLTNRLNAEVTALSATSQAVAATLRQLAELVEALEKRIAELDDRSPS
jgi:ABC-type transporter Mla subunit MlaD